MNFTARIKAKSKSPQTPYPNPKYVLNLTIDIPLTSKYALTSRETSREPSPQSNKLKRKFQVAITPIKYKSRSQSIQPKLSRMQTGHKKGATTSFQGKTNKFQKYKSIDLAQRNKKKNFSKVSSVIRNISVLDHLASDDSDNVIKYTNKTIEQNCQKDDFRIKLISSASDFHLLNVEEIRQYEGLATSRRQHLNCEYLRNMHMEASAKKIQKAWKNYMTKKLIKSYSLQSNKLKRPIITTLSESVSLNNKGLFWRKNKKTLKTLNRCPENGILFDSPRNDQHSTITKQRSAVSSDQRQEEHSSKGNSSREQTRDITAKLHEFQTQQTEKFQKLYKNALHSKKNSNSHNYQEIKKSEQLPKIIEANQALFVKDPIEKESSSSSQPRRIVNVENVENESEQNSEEFIQQTTAEKRMRKIAFFEKQIRKIDNEISEISNSSISLSPQQSKIFEQLQNKKLRKKLDLFDQMSLFKIQNDSQEDECQNQQYEDSSISNEQSLGSSSAIVNQLSKDMDQIINIKQKKLQRGRINDKWHKKRIKRVNDDNQQTVKMVQDPQSSLQIGQQDVQEGQNNEVYSVQQLILNPLAVRQEPQKNQLSKRLDKLPVMSQLELCKLVVEQLVFESLLDFSDSDQIANKMRLLATLHKSAKTGHQKSQKQKPEGICTNLDSIKDYLQNLVAYLLDNHHQTLEKGINTHAGPSPIVLFQYLRRVQVQDYQGNSTVIPLTLFDKHWNIASEQIYFDKKFDDQKLQVERIRYLKGLTKVYFRAIFDAFNESLEFNRAFGQLGKPYPWKRSCNLNHTLVDIKNAMRLSYKRLSTIATIYCGLHFQDKKHAVPDQVIRDVQEQRMNNLLTMELKEEQKKWSFFDDEEAQVLYEFTMLIEDEILFEACRDTLYVSLQNSS